MVVAPGTRDGQAQEASGDGIDPLIPLVSHDRRDHLGRELRFLVVDRRQPDETERGQFRSREARHEVGRELATDELVEREVVVEGLDDPVAVGVRVPRGFVGGLAGRVVLGVAGHVEPEPAPPLAVAR